MNRIITISIITIFFIGCSPSESNISTYDKEIIDYLINKYNEYSFAYNQIDGSGESVRNFYDRALDIAKEISDKEVPDYLYQYKNNLILGIQQQAQGVGCYSNKLLCKNDFEATLLLSQGFNKLNKFKSEISKYD